MKKIILISCVAVLLATTNLVAQSARYAPTMKTNLELLKNAKSMQDYNSVAAAFTRIGQAEKTLWVPYYYAALAKLHGAMNDQNVDKDAIAAQVDSLLSSAEAIQPNSELSTLHYYNEVLKMTVNPAARFMEEGPLLEKYYGQAVAQDSTNPRIYFMKGQTVFHTPESFGGGPAAAKTLFQKAVDLYATQDSTKDFKPKWGKEDAEAMLKQCEQ
jgi:hypothetical protein